MECIKLDPKVSDFIKSRLRQKKAVNLNLGLGALSCGTFAETYSVFYLNQGHF